jgi:hypothetical protein
LDEAAEVVADGGEHGVDRIAGGATNRSTAFELFTDD